MTQSARINIEVLDAVIDGHGKGAVIDVESVAAEYLVRIGYAKVVEVVKQAEKPKPSVGSKK
jgi:hypothetical protein